MQKVTLVCLASDREAALAELQNLGLVHVIPLTPPAGDDLDAARRLQLQAAETVQYLASLDAPAPAAAPAPADPQPLLTTVAELRHQLTQIDDEADALHQEQRQLAPLGSFDTAQIRALNAAGIPFRLFRESRRQPMSCPAGAVRIVLHESRTQRLLALAGPEAASATGDELRLPERSLQAVEARIATLGRAREAALKRLRELAAHLPTLRPWAASLRDQVRLQEARAGMGRTAALAYLQGFAPQADVPTLQQAAVTHGWALLAADPAPADTVPTLIRLPRWLRPIQSLFDMINILPGYREVDVSASFLLFLTLFFALIVADAGYGIVMLLVTLLARRKHPKASPAPFQLMYLFCAATIAVGVLTGTYFGMIEVALPFPALRAACKWLNDSAHMMHLCLLIGAVHLSVAHAWNGIRVINSFQALAQLGWIGLTWFLFAIAEVMLIGTTYRPWLNWLGIASVVAILVFMTPVKKLKSDWINHAMFPLNLMSGFGDLLSYLRLFALGVAGVQLAMAFDAIAVSVGFHSIGRALGAAVVLLAGHGLNIVLGAMSVLVHGIRLNALEFSMHMGLEWSGSPYRPFARHHPPLS